MALLPMVDVSAIVRHDCAMTDETRWFTGQFLLALPGIGDPRFDRAMIAMLSHDADGAMGIGVGAVLGGMSVGAIFDQLEIDHDGGFDHPVCFGGPVEPSRGFVLHSRDWGGQDTVDIAGRWMLSSSHDVLRAIAERRGPSRWVIALGYAGWAPDQLESEMVQHGWHVTPGDDELLFGTAHDKRWEAAFALEGIDARLLTTTGGEA